MDITFTDRQISHRSIDTTAVGLCTSVAVVSFHFAVLTAAHFKLEKNG